MSSDQRSDVIATGPSVSSHNIFITIHCLLAVELGSWHVGHIQTTHST
jgi:hypothetical protein